MIIDIRGVTKTYGRYPAVDSVSLTVERGEAVAILGANGAGKSTLLKCVLGIVAFSGDVMLDGMSVKKEPKKAKALMGYVPQEPVFYDMPARDLLLFFSRLRRIEESRIDAVLELVGLSEHARKPTSALSGGMKQRLSFAMALLANPPVLILDEPTSNLDASARAEFLSLVDGLKKAGKTVLFSSHRMDEVEFLADRVFVMKRGAVRVESTPDELPGVLGISTLLYVTLPPSSLQSAVAALEREGFRVAATGTSTVCVEVTAQNKTLPLRVLLLSEIPVADFRVEEPSMDRILEEVGRDGF
jgi:ABC-type multidrug transport system ATPase subunit